MLLFLKYLTVFSILLDIAHAQVATPQMPDVQRIVQSYFNMFNPRGHGVIPNRPHGRQWANLYERNFSYIANKCPPHAFYATFNPDHREAVAALTALYEDKNDIDTVLEFSQFAKDHPSVHPHVWYASLLRMQSLRMPGSLSMDRPSPIHIFPSTFFPSTFFPPPIANAGQIRVKRSPQQSQFDAFTFPDWPSDWPGFSNQFAQQQQQQQPQALRPQQQQRRGPWPPQQQPPQQQPPQQQPPQQQPPQQLPPQQQPPQQQPPQQQPPQQQPQCVVLDERFSQDNPESQLWYFREDLQLNAHHWTWHLLFPGATSQQIPRRGEFFYYFHHDLLARYCAERLSNGFANVVPMDLQLNAVLAESYNPHMTDGISTIPWAPRAANRQLDRNSLAPIILEQLNNVTTVRDRIINIINTGNVNQNGRPVAINNADNVNILGELTEASQYSINPQYYGTTGIHNDGHWVVANILGVNIPRGAFGVIGHVATAVRDPMFFRWHKFLDVLFSSYKTTHLPPYALTAGENPLVLGGVRVSSIAVAPDGNGGTANNLNTFWMTKNLTIQGGLDFNTENSNNAPTINVCAKHLDHDEFSYQIQIENTRSSATNTFVRIFMAPRYRTANGQDRYTFEEQRILFFAMDAFVQPLQPGSNVITRRSSQSVLTTPWPRSVEQLNQDIRNGRFQSVPCECGYPHHLLLPKGTEGGMAFDLFVMVTDGSDWIENPPAPFSPLNSNSNPCIPSYTHCGVPGGVYPDAKPMGYPFDRRPYLVTVQGPQGTQNVPPANLDQYISNVPNMATAQVVIVHQNVMRGFSA